ncbi:MAG: TetR/AcrR family transcriptional regulator [Shimia sp.]|uniref:TetR/AcrR family transcriptional regulator n=1 Tax=Shimia sp. TaxID=1954381 RepID=UPI003B8BE9B7
MARKRKADHETAIAGALALFWEKGYTGASTREIEEKTGLTRFTLQTAYGGKEAFFLATLDSYLNNAEAQHFPDAETFTLSDLAEWFESIASEQKIPRVEDAGCLAFNSISQFDRSDPEVNARISRYLETLEGRFAAILTRAAQAGTVQLPQSPEAAAQVLVGLLLGLHSVIKARTEDSMARSYAAAAAGLMRSWEVS